jgi:hypothetical protein
MTFNVVNECYNIIIFCIDGGEMMFKVGDIHKRTELHSKYGGQKQGGISTPVNHEFIMLFTGEQGE